MISKNKIILLYPYFGKLPWYFNLFIHSCQYNPSIDFLILSDEELKVKLPENVRYAKLTLRQFQQLSSKKIQCKVKVDPAPFKFCDLRPAFGLIFSDYINGYDFWGHGDIDVIFGDIRKFITDEILAIHELIFVRHDYISSWFSIYKNCSEINNLFRLSKDYLKVFATPRYFNFDEANFMFTAFSNGINYADIKSEIESMTHLVRKLAHEKKINPYFDLHAIEGLTGKMEWRKGKLTFDKSFEILLYHLLQLKKVYKPDKVGASFPDEFRITKTMIQLLNRGNASIKKES